MNFRFRAFYREALRATTIELVFRCLAIILGFAPIEKEVYRKPLSPECRETCRRLDRYTAEITLSSQEKFQDRADVERFISTTETEISELTQARGKVRNQQKSCKDPTHMTELRIQCTHLTQGLVQLRKRRKTAKWILEDYAKARELIGCEYRSRVLNDPYLTDKEKQTLRGESVPQKNYER